MPTDIELLILGGGCAGLSLAMQLARFDERIPKTLILEQRSRYKNDRTWCFWGDEKTPFAALASHRWRAVSVANSDKTVRVECASSSYRMLASDHFYSAAVEALSKTSKIQLQMDSQLLSEPQFKDGRWNVQTSNGAFSSAMVVDTRPTAPVANDSALMWQSFLGQEIECLPWVGVRESGCASGGRDAVRTEGDSTHEHRCEQSGSKELPCPRRLAFDLDDVPAPMQTSTTCRGAGFTERADQLHGRRSFTGTDLLHSPDFVAFRVRGLLSKGEERRGHRMMQHARQTLANRLLANEALSLSAQKLLSSELQSLVLDKDYERAAQVSAEPSVALLERSMPSAISGKEDEDDPTPSPLCATGRTRADMLAGPALPPPRRLASAFEATIRAVAHQRSFGFVPDELAWTPRPLPSTMPLASDPDDPLLAEVDAFLFQHRSGLSPRYLHAHRSSTSTPSRGERHARSRAVTPVEGDDDRGGGMSASRRLHQPSPKCDWECDLD